MCDRFRVRHAETVDEPCPHVCCHGDVYVCVTGFVFAMLRLWTNPVHMCVVMVMYVCAIGFVFALLRLWTNPVYMCVMVSNCALLFSVAGGQSFNAKYIENQFSFPTWKANMSLGKSRRSTPKFLPSLCVSGSTPAFPKSLCIYPCLPLSLSGFTPVSPNSLWVCLAYVSLILSMPSVCSVFVSLRICKNLSF